MMRPHRFFFPAFLLLSALYACSSDEDKKSIADDPTGGTGGASGAASGAGSGASGQGGSSAGGSAGGTAGLGGSASGSAGAGGASGDAGQAGSGQAGAAGEAGSAGQGGAGGGQAGAAGSVDVVGGGSGVSGSAGSGGFVPDPEPECKPKQPWNPQPSNDAKVLPDNLFGELKEDRTLADITPSALSIAWFAQSGVYVADRAATTEAFGQYKKLPSSLEASGYPGIDKVALSATGLQMVLVNVERKRFGEMKRLNLGESFDGLTEEPFKAIHDALQADEYLGDPVLTGDDKALYYAAFKGDNSSKIMVSLRDTAQQPWGAPTPLASDTVDSPVGPRKRLWSVSHDQLTFFFYDPSTQESKAAWRKNIGKPIDDIRTIGKIDTPIGAPTCVQMNYTARGSDQLLNIFLIQAI